MFLDLLELMMATEGSAIRDWSPMAKNTDGKPCKSASGNRNAALETMDTPCRIHSSAWRAAPTIAFLRRFFHREELTWKVLNASRNP
jgi:hypothetical protein